VINKQLTKRKSEKKTLVFFSEISVLKLRKIISLLTYRVFFSSSKVSNKKIGLFGIYTEGSYFFEINPFICPIINRVYQKKYT
jgi:hypothetical protein